MWQLPARFNFVVNELNLEYAFENSLLNVVISTLLKLGSCWLYVMASSKMPPPALSAGHASAKHLPASHQQQKHARQPAATHARQPAANMWARWSDIKTASQKLLTVTAAVRGGLLTALSVLSKKKKVCQRSLFGLEPGKNHLKKYPVLIHAFDSDHESEAHSEMLRCIRGIRATTTAWLKTHCSHQEFGCKLSAAPISFSSGSGKDMGRGPTTVCVWALRVFEGRLGPAQATNPQDATSSRNPFFHFLCPTCDSVLSLQGIFVRLVAR